METVLDNAVATPSERQHPGHRSDASRRREGRPSVLRRFWTHRQLHSIKRLPRYQPFTTRVLGGSLCVVDSLSFYYSFREIFERQIYRFITDTTVPRIIDGGANIGLSVIYFKRLHPHARITAFEPDSDVFRALQKNACSFGLPDVELVNAALWREETTLEFFCEGADGGRLGQPHDMVNSQRVQTARLRSYLCDPVDMLKLDIEGAEVEVLVDCAEALKNVRNIFVEYHSFYDQPQRLDEMLLALRNAGLRVQIHTQYSSPQPLLRTNQRLGMDLQLNVFGYRV